MTEPPTQSHQSAAVDRSSSLDALIGYLKLAGASDPHRSAGALLREFGSVGSMLSGSMPRLTDVVGPRLASLIRASHILVQTSLLEQVRKGPVLASRDEVMRYLQLHLGSLRHERLIALYLDADSRLIHSARIAEGSVGKMVPSITRVIHLALDVGATGILLVHNHPSGDATPSRSDFLWTARLSRVAADLDLSVVDHIIVAGTDYQSLFEIAKAGDRRVTD